MKKLLSVLAASSMMVVAPLNVISCKKEEKDLVIDEFDFAKLFNQYIADVSTVYENEIFESFLKYSWITTEELESTGISLNELIQNQDDLKNPKSNLYLKISKEIYNIMPVNQVNRKLASTVTNNVNYSPILVDTDTPLKNGINIESMTLHEKGDNLTLAVKLTSDVFYKDPFGNRSYQQIFTMVSINVFAKPDEAKAAKKVSDIFFKTFNGENSNQYEFLSDSGNLSLTESEINKDNKKLQSIKDEIDNMDISSVDFRFNPKMVTSGVTLQSNSSATTDSSSFKSESNLGIDSQRGILLNSALSGHKIDEDKFLRMIQDENLDWMKQIIGSGEWNDKMLEAAVTDPKMSKAINQYNLSQNIENNNVFQSILSSQSSEFAIDLERDKLVIAVFGVKINKVKFELSNQLYDLPTQTIFYRQKTKYLDTSSLYKDFMEAAFRFQQEFMGLKGSEPDPDINSQTYFIPISSSYMPIMSNSRDRLTHYRFLSEEIFEPFHQENQNDKFKMSHKLVQNETDKIPTYYYVNSENEQNIWFTEGFEKGLNQTSLKTYFFSSGLTDKNKLCYYFDQPETRRKDVAGSDERWIHDSTINKGDALWEIKWIGGSIVDEKTFKHFS
ncbi:hypothetical protein [Spiroplasma endosymbiont of Panorpa germanica]|uniref:hypothetical protein n=1 Tax=Spiroplasma endosymbiont of Panorpa germanica TaxID=3066314 RepID=UPI0030D46AC0